MVISFDFLIENRWIRHEPDWTCNFFHVLIHPMPRQIGLVTTFPSMSGHYVTEAAGGFLEASGNRESQMQEWSERERKRAAIGIRWGAIATTEFQTKPDPVFSTHHLCL